MARQGPGQGGKDDGVGEDLGSFQMRRWEAAGGTPGDGDLQTREDSKNYYKKNSWNVPEDVHGLVEGRGTKSGRRGHLVAPNSSSDGGGYGELR
jgi:hypothetical protein